MDIVLEQPARARLITSESQDLPVSATLRYSAADPLAVEIVFPPEASLDGNTATWIFARELLETGLSAPAGSGDVHIWPCGPARTVLEFHALPGLALIQFDTAVLRRFLLRSYAVVAAGREDVGPALERGLTSLLGGV
ncbi:SsgA family sporulation/cell division regulator [Streptomyces sporangiiformans]|uniref:SsgA family sporulation/cell division regulator n=1 Tax=Streptomyces sporangiiformans TaxID=2315329 RepID=A0A505DPM7_9ACTN|nr:SsgA family sporulation/cell division regulator [Streptomyces sporangiiformans]TPQ23185.1 SsgA family sporulation/cell division regulator [Streptomyces sporangiiformans]